MAQPKPKGPEYFRDPQGKWWWRLTHPNGNIVAGSTEGYERIAGAENGYDSARALMLADDTPLQEKMTDE